MVAIKESPYKLWILSCLPHKSQLSHIQMNPHCDELLESFAADSSSCR